MESDGTIWLWIIPSAVQSQRFLMTKSRRYHKLLWPLIALVGMTLALSGCNLPLLVPSEEPGPSTQRAATAAAVLTQSGPSIRQTGESLQTVPAPPASATNPAPQSSETGTTAVLTCDHRAAFVDDVTVRDNTRFDPGESFVKVWRLRNSSECTWTPGYLLTFFGGNRLGASSTVPLSQDVPPGEDVDLAVDMRAPSSPGTYQGFWKMRSPEGEFFGIGPQGDQSFWVKIQVPAPPTAEASPSDTPTATPTPSATAIETEVPSDTPTVTFTGTEGPTSTPSATHTPTGTVVPTASPTEDES